MFGVCAGQSVVCVVLCGCVCVLCWLCVSCVRVRVLVVVCVRVFDGVGHVSCCGLWVDVSCAVWRMVWVISNAAPLVGRTERNGEMSKSVMRMVVALMLGVLALVGCVPAYAVEDTAPAGGWVLAATGAPVDVSGTPACDSEGQEFGPCLWDARTMGNRQGRSFIVEEDGSVSYLRWRDAREMAFPGWLWVGSVEPASTGGLPSCADVNGEVTCQRDGRYVLEVNAAACTQTITTGAGDRYVPGPAVAKALSESCPKPTVKGHSDEAGLNGARSSSSMGVVHSAAPNAAVDSVVDKPSSPSRDKVVGPVVSGVKDNYDREILVVAAVVTLGGLTLAVWVERRAARRRVSRFGSR